MLHVICTRLRPGHLSVRVGDSLGAVRRLHKKISNCTFGCDYYYYLNNTGWWGGGGEGGCMCVCLSVCHHQFVWLGLFLCTLIRYIGFMGILFMLSWMFQHDYLDTYCFECLICICCIWTCSAQLSMFHMERRSRNTLIIIIVIIIIIIIITASLAWWLRRPPRERNILSSIRACAAGIFHGRVILVT